MKKEIYIGTVLLEKTRWSSKIASYRVSEWVERFRADGFDGLELWENHVMGGPQEEIERLKNSRFPVAVYSSYVNFEDEAEGERREAAEITVRLGAKGIKYNLGRNPADCETYLKNLKSWAACLPPDCRILCECHDKTIMETPDAAAGVFERLDDKRFQAIVHPFEDGQILRNWFARLGERITHAHLRLKENNRYLKLRRRKALVKECLEIMQKCGFSGTYTLEFTEGVNTPDENMEDLYRSAVEDLRFLREEALG